MYIVGFCALWLCLGGWLAIAPACTGVFCGTKYYGPNYGLVFTAYGAGAIIGNLLAGRLRDIVGSYVAVFYPVAALAVVGRRCVRAQRGRSRAVPGADRCVKRGKTREA